MGKFLDFFKVRPTIKANIKPSVQLSLIDILLEKIKAITNAEDIEKRLCEPDSVLFGLMVHSVKFNTLYAISRNIFYKYSGAEAYDGINQNVFLVDLGNYFSIGSMNHRPCKDWLYDIEIILNHFKEKKSNTPTERLIIQDIKSILDAVDSLTKD